MLACSALCTLSLTAQTYATGDPRHPGQPNPPAVCETLTADFSTSQRSNPPSSDDTSRIQAALNNCKNTAGTPRFTDILVDGAKSVASTHSAYSTIVGLSSAPVQLYLADISFDVTTQNADANATVFLDNSNITPSGQNVTTQSFSTGGSVPNCSF